MSNIDLNDPRLTAYALNEMDPAERAEFEQLLAQEPAARQAVEQIAATASLLVDALEQEAMEPVGKPAPRHDTYAKVIQFPYWRISGLAAACFALFFIYLQRQEIAKEQKQYIEVPLTGAQLPSAPEPMVLPVPLTTEADGAKREELPAQTMARVAKQSQERSARDQLLKARNEAIDSAAQKAGVATAPMPVPMSVEAGSALPALAGVAQLDKKEASTPRSVDVSGSDKTSLGAGPAFAGAQARTELKGMATATTVATGQISAGHDSEGSAAGVRQDKGGYVAANDHQLSNIPAKVAPASYAEVQRFVTEGRRPPAEVVRIEELVNHFSYNYPPPAGSASFSANLEVAGAPWAPAHRLVRIGLKARAAEALERAARVEPGDGKLMVIAKDVQIQVEFNPRQVQAYRLIGYESRRPAKEDMRHTRANLGVDGADQALTVLYEVVPVGVEISSPAPAAEYERPGKPRAGSQGSNPVEMLTVEIRYKEPVDGANRRLEFPLRDRGTTFANASEDFKFAAAVAGFGMLLQDSPLKGAATWSAVTAWARDGLGDDAGGQRGEFLGLVDRARLLQ